MWQSLVDKHIIYHSKSNRMNRRVMIIIYHRPGPIFTFVNHKKIIKSIKIVSRLGAIYVINIRNWKKWISASSSSDSQLSVDIHFYVFWADLRFLSIYIILTCLANGNVANLFLFRLLKIHRILSYPYCLILWQKN